MELERQIIVGGNLLKITRIAACVSGSGLFWDRLHSGVIIVLVVATAIISCRVTASSGGITLWLGKMDVVRNDFERFALGALAVRISAGLNRTLYRHQLALMKITADKFGGAAPRHDVDKINLAVSAGFYIGTVTAKVKLVTATSLGV